MFQYEKERIYYTDVNNKILAEVTFPVVNPYTVEITHTFVDSSLRGQGIAGKLIQAVCDRLRSEGKKANATCPYAKTWFEGHPSYKDVYQK